jgi:type IV secretory pathway protease TraF
MHVPSQPVVLIIFYCQSGDTEQLALSAAVGAVQSRALIRLRRLPDMGLTSETQALLRMRKEYVPPTEKDILAADALIIVAPPNSTNSDLQWRPYLELIRRLPLTNKVAACIGLDINSLKESGIITVTNPSADALTLGRAVADAARARKQQQEPS